MHAKTDSDVSHVTSMGTLSPPRSPTPRPPTQRAVYYVESPSFSHDLDKCSFDGATPLSPTNYHYHCSPIHHSRESSTSRLFSSANLKLHGGGSGGGGGWRRIYGGRRLDYGGGGGEGGAGEDDDDDDGGGGDGPTMRFYVGCFLVSFVGLFSAFALILWGASKSSHPHILVKNMVFLDFTIQAGMDGTGVPTDMLSLNSTVRIYYKNPATFFGVHVTSSPLELYYYNLKVASGQMKKFYQKRKSHSNRTTVVQGHQVPLYGGMLLVSNARAGNSLHTEKVNVGLNLTFTVRSRAYILGMLVKSKFYTKIRCPVTLHGTGLGKPTNLLKSCIYE